MAHTFKHEGNTYALAQILTSMVAKDLILASTVRRDFAAEFDGKRGAVINVRVPATLTAKNRTLDADPSTGVRSTIVTDDLTESTQSVSLTHQIYSAVDVDVYQRELEIEDYSAQVTAPQALALVEDIEERVVAAMQGVTAHSTLSSSYSAAAPVKTFTAVRKALRDMAVPAAGMYAAVGTEIYQNLLDSASLQQVDLSGSTSALRDANVGRVAGFTVVESNRLDEDEAVFYNRDAFVLVLRAPAPPRGGAAGSSVARNGVALSLVLDYDPTTMTDRQIAHTLVGAGTFKVRQSATSGNTLVVPAIRIKLA